MPNQPKAKASARAIRLDYRKTMASVKEIGAETLKFNQLKARKKVKNKQKKLWVFFTYKIIHL